MVGCLWIWAAARAWLFWPLLWPFRSGRYVTQATPLIVVSLCRGVELLEGLHATAVTAVASLRRAIEDGACSGPGTRDSGAVSKSRKGKLCPSNEDHSQLLYWPSEGVEFILGDLTSWEWAEQADIVWMASLLFDAGLMAKITQASRGVKKGARIITLQKLVENVCGDDFDLVVDGSWFRMSWNHARVYVYRRR
jgi:hypothetical protein